MSEYVSARLRELVATRAENRCEYCHIHAEDAFFGCEVDHIISTKHGGSTSESNLAYSCANCNRNKGSDLGSIFWQTGELIRFFNPRMDSWDDHFDLEGPRIATLTNIGEVTARILGFNSEERMLERRELIALERYP